MKKITLIITALNEGEEPNATVKSIYETADPDVFNIIVIDDGSDKPVKIDKKYPVNLIRFDKRKGIHYARDYGVSISETKYCALFNARMRFTAGWMDKIIKHLDDHAHTLFCTTSVVLYPANIISECEKMIKAIESNKFDMTKKQAGNYITRFKDKINELKDKKGLDVITDDKLRIYGADIIGAKAETNQFMQVQWRKLTDKGNVYDIPCVIGACYFFSKKWYQHIGGLEGLAEYGSDEEYLSLKTWAFGGRVKIATDVEIGNLYHVTKLYLDNNIRSLFNKTIVAFTLLDWDYAYSLFIKCFQMDLFVKEMTIVMKDFIRDLDSVMALRNKYQKMKIVNINHLIK